MLSRARLAWEEAGLQVIGTALAGKAADGLQKGSAIVKKLIGGDALAAIEQLTVAGQLRIERDDVVAAVMVEDWLAQRDPAKPGESLMLAGTKADVCYQHAQGPRGDVRTSFRTAVGKHDGSGMGLRFRFPSSPATARVRTRRHGGGSQSGLGTVTAERVGE